MVKVTGVVLQSNGKLRLLRRKRRFLHAVVLAEASTILISLFLRLKKSVSSIWAMP